MVTAKLVVATDGSGAAREAERFAATLARGLNTSVDVLCVAQPASGSGFASSGSVMPLETEQEDEIIGRDYELRAALQRVRELLPDTTIRVRGFLLEDASPAKAIVEFCDDSVEPVTAVVMGNRGKGGLPRLLLGSVSDQVVKTASCPVVVVKARVDDRGGANAF